MQNNRLRPVSAPAAAGSSIGNRLIAKGESANPLDQSGQSRMGRDTFSHLAAKTNLRVEVFSSPMLEQTMRRDDFVSDEEARTGDVPMLERRRNAE